MSMTLIDLTNSPKPSPVKKKQRVEPAPERISLPSLASLQLPAFARRVEPVAPLVVPPPPRPRSEIDQQIERLYVDDLRQLVDVLLTRSPRALKLAETLLFRPAADPDEVLECESCHQDFTLRTQKSSAGPQCTYHLVSSFCRLHASAERRANAALAARRATLRA